MYYFIHIVFQEYDEYYEDYYEDYKMYDEDHLPDLTKPVDRIAAASNADYSSGSVRYSHFNPILTITLLKI